MFNTGKQLNYFGANVEVVTSNNTHVLIQFENGIKICINKNIFLK